MSSHLSPRRATPLRRLLLASVAVASCLLAVPAASHGALVTVGSPLSVPATLNTTQNLAYRGLDTPVPPNPEAPNGIFHTFHYGADTAIWNTSSAGGAAMPQAGQAVKVKLEGCVMAAPGGPAPLDQFHFQDLTPLPGGGARVNISSQSFTIPTCGVGGASGSTVSTYEPINLCVKQGDYVDFNDEGGYVPNIYRSGAPYEVLGAVPGAALDSFIRSNGTGNGSVLSASDTTAMDGFGASTGEELMLQVLLGTGSDARYVCAGGSKDAPAVLAPMRVSPQTDGVNHQRLVSVAIYCRPAAGCTGNAQLTLAGGRSVGSSAFSLPGAKTSHLAIRVSPALMPLIRKRHSGVATTLLVTMEGRTYSATVNVRIL